MCCNRGLNVGYAIICCTWGDIFCVFVAIVVSGGAVEGCTGILNVQQCNVTSFDMWGPERNRHVCTGGLMGIMGWAHLLVD